MTANEKQAFINLIHEPAHTSDPVLPTTAFTEENLRLHLSSAAASGLTTLGLTIHKKAVPSDAILNFQSVEWKDREGTVFGVALPDVFRLDFTVRIGNFTHEGPFALIGNQSAPIILPKLPPEPVGGADRELVQVIYLSDGLTGAERAMYQFIEGSTEALTRSILGGSYRRMVFLKGPDTTLPKFVAALQSAAAKPQTESVDVIFTTHGTSEKVHLADGTKAASALRDAMLTIPQTQRQKLRVIFSTVCFGATHLDEWIAAGFNEAAGARGIYADSAVPYAPMLGAWALKKTFAECVAAANNVDPLKVADNLARAFYVGKGKDSTASQVDSHRLRGGTGRTRIYSTP